MKKYLIIVLVALPMLIFSAHVQAGGSVDLTDIQPLLAQEPSLWKLYSDGLEISPHGGGLRLGSADIPLRGYRVGPYEFLAKLKGSKEPYDLKLTITTDLYFLDAQNREVTDEKLAIKKEEMLKSISIEPVNPPARNGSFIQSSQ